MIIAKVALQIANCGSKKSNLQSSNANFKGKRVNEKLFSNWFFNEVKSLTHLDDSSYKNLVRTKFFAHRDSLGGDNFILNVAKAETREQDYHNLRHYIKIGLNIKDESTNIDYPIGKYSSLDDFEAQALKKLPSEARTPMDNLFNKPGEYNPIING